MTEQPTVIPAKIPISSGAMTLIDALKQGDQRVEVYAVGGIVRDWLHHHFHGAPGSNFGAKDEDLTTNLSEEEILKKLRGFYAQQKGIKVKEKESVDTFGVVFASVAGSPTIEIAPFRKDIGSVGGRRPERVERGNIQDDAMRRDLTMNNLYYDPLKGVILDLNPGGQGIKDVREGIARPVGDPFQRFDEDKLRVLRLVRFFSRFNAGKIKEKLDQKTLAAIDHFKNLYQYTGITPERIQMEFLAGIKQSQNTSSFLSNLAELDLFGAIFPSLQLDVQNITRLGNSKNPRVVIAWLLRQNKNVDAALNNLKYPNEIGEPVQFLVNAMQLGTENAVDVIKSRDRRLVRPGKKKTELSPEDQARNQQILDEMRGDLTELSKVIGTNMLPQEQPAIDRLQHLGQYNLPQISGDELMKQGFKGEKIGQEQKRRGTEDYSRSFADFLKSKNQG